MAAQLCPAHSAAGSGGLGIDAAIRRDLDRVLAAFAQQDGSALNRRQARERFAGVRSYVAVERFIGTATLSATASSRSPSSFGVLVPPLASTGDGDGRGRWRGCGR